MKSISIIGAKGFVGSAIFEHARNHFEKIYTFHSGDGFPENVECDVCINCSGISKKYSAEEDLLGSVCAELKKIDRFMGGIHAKQHILISSVDVYKDLGALDKTKETENLSISGASKYGTIKQIVEKYFMVHSSNWLIFRLSGMIGKNLKKNPVYDIINGHQLYIHPDSEYQFINTSNVAAAIFATASTGIENEIFNVAGSGLISPRDISRLLGRELNLPTDVEDMSPRVVNVDNSKIAKHVELPNSLDEIAFFLKQYGA